MACSLGSSSESPLETRATGPDAPLPPPVCGPSISVPLANASIASSQGIFVELDLISGTFSERQLRMRPIEVSTPDGADIDASGADVEIYDDGGSMLSLPHALGAGGSPHTLYVRGTEYGSATIEVAPDGACGEPDATLDVRVGKAPGLAGRELADYPFFEFVDAFNHDDSVQTAIDPTRYFDREGLTYDVYVVEHKSVSEWNADNTLVDVGDGVITATVQPGSQEDNILDVWLSTLTTGDTLVTGYDVVYDFGRDGTLDPGDVIDGAEQRGFGAVAELQSMGPHATADYTYSVSFWETMLVYYPTDIASLGEVPLIIISHGNGHDYTWYDYLGEQLASWGYVVMSHRNDTGPGVLTAADTTFDNTEVFLRDLSIHGGGVLDGHIDRDNIVWSGHSRGGEGVVIAYDRMFDGTRSSSEFTVDDIVLVSSIAPTVFRDPNTQAHPHDVVYHQINGSADGDVTGAPGCDLCQWFRIFHSSTNDNIVTYVQGAIHNDFNCCGFNDGIFVSGPGVKIGRTEAQRVAKSYYTALYEYYLRGDEIAGEYLKRLSERSLPSGVSADLSNMFRTAEHADKFVIDDFQTNGSSLTSSSGGSVSFDVRQMAEGDLDDNNTQLVYRNSDPLNGSTWSDGDGTDADAGAAFSWAPADELFFQWEVTAGNRDWSDYSVFSFRAAQGTRHRATDFLDDLMSFTVTLEDSAGRTSSIDFGNYGRIHRPFKRSGSGSGNGWVNEFTTVRIDLTDFEVDGSDLDLSDIEFVRFEVGPSKGTAPGRVVFDDIEVLRNK